MANETTIDTETARRLLLILSLEGDVKKEEIEWALAIIHQIPGYGGIALAKAVQDRALKEILVAIAAEQISPTTPKDLKALIEDAEKREAALKTAKETGEKRAEEFIEAAEKAAKTKAQVEVSPVTPEAPSKEEALPKEGFSIKVSQSFVKEFSNVGKAAVHAPLKVVSFFSPPPSLRGAVQDATAMSLALTDLAAKARAARNIEEKRVFQALHDALEEAQYSAVARLNLPMRLASITGVRVTLLSGQELGLPQGQVAALLQTSAGKPSLLGTIGKGLGQRLLGQASGKLVKGFLGKAAAKLGAAAAGAPAGPPGIIASALASFAPDFLSWLKRNASKVAIGIGAFLFGAGFVFQSPILMAGGGAVGFGGLVGGAGGVGPALSKAGGFASSVISGVASLAVASIATPLIVALISIPVLVAIILFIINSGAYIVPLSPLQLPGAIESPYIGVEKTASPDCMNRNGCPGFGTVTYTVRVTAKKGTLTNVSITNEYTVIGKATQRITPPTIPVPETISPTQAYEFSYTVPVGPAYDDSIISDTVTVKADAPEQKGAIASWSATVVVGNPAVNCPLPGGQSSQRHWSYYPGNESGGHGSNDYWQRMGGAACRYAIPLGSGCKGPTNSGNTCSDQGSTCDFYGYAMDVFPSGNNQVLAPTVKGQSVTWSYVSSYSQGSVGYTHVYRSTEYYLALTHLRPNANTGSSISSGQTIGELYPLGDNTHIHIEFQVGGRYVRPEDFFCR